MANTTTTSMTSQATSQSSPASDSMRPFLYFFGSFYLSIVAISITANFLTCYVIFKSRRLQSTTNYFIVTMATFGLFLDGAALLLAGRVLAFRWPYYEEVCRLIAFIVHSAAAADTCILCAISFDRFYTIVYPLSFKITVKSSKRLSLASWGLGLVVGAPAIYFYSLSGDRCEPFIVPRTGQIIYGGLLLLLVYVIPGIAVLVNYCRTIRFVWTFEMTLHGSRLMRRTVHHVPRTKIKIIKILLAVTIIDFIILALFYTLMMTRLAGVYFAVELISVLGGLAFLTGTIKPVLYISLNSNFRRGVKEVLCWTKLHCYREELYTVTRMSALARKNYVTSVDPDHENKIYEYVTGASKVSPINSTFDRSILLEKDRWPITHPVKYGIPTQQNGK